MDWVCGRADIIDKIMHDATKVGLEVEGIKRNAQTIRYAPSIERIRCAAATLFVVGSPLKDR